MAQLMFIVLACSLCLAAMVRAQTGEPERVFIHPLTNMPGPSEDVETSHFYPGNTDNKFPIGQTVTVLCHLSNEGEGPLNVTAIMGSLNYVFDFRHHIQNYTYKPFGIVVKSGEEVTLQYQFQLHPELEPMEYTLAHTAFYESDTESFSSTFFNSTVELIHSNADLDIVSIGQLLFSFLCTIATAILTFFACFPEKSAELMGTATKKKTASGSWDDDFVVVSEPESKTKRRKSSGGKK